MGNYEVAFCWLGKGEGEGGKGGTKEKGGEGERKKNSQDSQALETF